MDTLTLVRLLTAGLAAKKADDTVAYDVRRRSDITDFHVLANGQNAPHLKSLLNETRRLLKANGTPHHRTSGDPASGWIVIDCLDVVVHLFTPAARHYYALDALWTDAPRLAPGA